MNKVVKIVAVLVLVITSSAFLSIEKTHDHAYKIGDVIEDFSLKNIDGNMVSLADYKDAKGFILTPAVKPGDNFEAMQERAQDKGFTFPYLVDEGQKIYPKFGATKTPHNYVLQKTEKGIVIKYIGAIDDSSRNPEAVSVKYLENAVDALLDGKAIELKETKAIGCSIKV